MHKSSYLRMEYLLNWYRPYWDNKDKIRILDIGSYNQGGTYRDCFLNEKYSYFGLDMVAGPNVDIVPANIYVWNEIENDSFDVVISGQVFEHIEYPWITIKEIERVLVPGGFCFITAPNAGVEHKAPKDCYRYFSDGLMALAKWANLSILHTSVAGIPNKKCINEWVSDWNDSFLVAQKAPREKRDIKDPFRYEARWLSDGRVHISYKNLEIAIQDIKENVRNSKQFILFGAGKLGEEVLDILGEECVYCYADNSKYKIGKKIKGKNIISLAELKEIKDEFNVVVSAYSNVAFEIKKQLFEEDIEAHLLYLEE